MIDRQNLFGEPVKNSLITYDNIQKTTTGQGGDFKTGCLLDYNYFNKYCKMIAIDLSTYQTLNADPKSIQQIDFTGNLYHVHNILRFFDDWANFPFPTNETKCDY